MGHLRMMSAVQPFLSGAISKTVNMPEAATAGGDRDGLPRGLEDGPQGDRDLPRQFEAHASRSAPARRRRRRPNSASRPPRRGRRSRHGRGRAASRTAAVSPTSARPITHKFDIAGHEGYITVGLYEDGQPGEIFLKMAKEGSTISGLMDTFATTVSVALQYGVPLHDLVFKFAHVRFEPSGFTSNPEIPIAKSIVDYIFRWLGSRFLPPEDRAALGLVDRSATAESSIQPLTLGFGQSANGIAGTSGSAPSAAASPASPPSGVTAVAAPDAGAPATPPARETSTDHRSDATPPTSSAYVPAPGLNGNGTRSNGSGSSNGASLRAALGNLGIGKAQVTFSAQADAPSCADCGSIMVRNGSCYKCLNCGSTSGCS